MTENEDIVAVLRREAENPRGRGLRGLLLAAADEIEQLRQGLHDQGDQSRPEATK
jgi:hypothetical protein